MIRLLSAAAVLLLVSCSAVVPDLAAPANTPAQQAYRAEGVTEAAARWVQAYIVQPKADPIAAASMIDSVRAARAGAAIARKSMGQGADASRGLSDVGEALLGLVLVAEAGEGISAPPGASGGAALALAAIDDATARLNRLGAARARLADLRGRLAVMQACHRDPTPAEWSAQDSALAAAYADLLKAARLPPAE